MMARMLVSTALHAAETQDSAVPRTARFLVNLLDGLLLVACLVAATAVAFAWLFVATRAGSATPTSFQATIAWSMVMAAVPAWAGVLVATSARDAHSGSTPGQVRRRLTVPGSRRQRIARLSVHPISALAWWWAAAVAALATLPLVPLVLASLGLVALGGGFVSAVIVAVRPGTLALHDRIAGTPGPRSVDQ
jgi:hypothetical protein